MEYCCQPVYPKRRAQTSVVYESPLAENVMYPLQVQKRVKEYDDNMSCKETYGCKGPHSRRRVGSIKRAAVFKLDDVRRDHLGYTEVGRSRNLILLAKVYRDGVEGLP